MPASSMVKRGLIRSSNKQNLGFSVTNGKLMEKNSHLSLDRFFCRSLEVVQAAVHVRYPAGDAHGRERA